ncbi:increased DNA methylation 3-like [Solanum dulcamara]|uniref:increased DNA methylation 3-like n=1 Tax=Solanum dulcamara TaxID=45834 RepID=UPI0024863529|nr:increased DNA methylation 3-like [Solanum dulcamara]
MNSDESAMSHAKPDVTLTGTAKTCLIGPPLGLVDIGSSENAYLFRVALPGVRHKCNIKFDIQKDGRVRIEGAITESEALKNSPKGYEMKVQQLPSPGPFTISFNLPGPVDPRLCSPHFRSDGILEAIVMKYQIPLVSAEGLPENWYNGSFPAP